MTLIVLALIGLMVLVVTVSPPDPGTREERPPAPRIAPLTDPDAFDVSEDLSTDGDASDQVVDAELGDRVQITVQGSTPDSVLLGDLDAEDVEAGYPARFELLADTPGSYPLLLVNEERQIGSLLVR
jgi:hypothetical protein